MRSLIIFLLCVVAGCASPGFVEVPSVNHNGRVNHLVIHFTSENYVESLRLLTERTERPVSVHYLVPDPRDATYTRRDLKIHRLVPENRRAWHAGRSSWGGAQALNDTSIGIEIVNRSYCKDNNTDSAPPTPETQTCLFLAYDDRQIELVTRLASDILRRYPDIDPVDVVGHGDIASDRRVDPGPLFPWKRLYKNGIGAWYDEGTVERYRRRFDRNQPGLALVQRALGAYGYQIDETGQDDPQTRFAIRAFQMHFRPSRTSGAIDAETTAILFALLEKYRPRVLESLLAQESVRMTEMEPG